MVSKTFDGTNTSPSNTVFDGLDGLTGVIYNGSSLQFQKAVVISVDSGSPEPQYLDNFGHQMFGIEYLEMSDKKDRLDIAYDLADTAGIATGGSGADKFFLSIDLNGGNDVLKIGDDLPAVKGASKNWGALVDGGTGNDKINGGQLNDQLAGGEGNDFVRGGGGDDILNGVNGNDTIYGEDGNDRITLDSFTLGGSDTAYGGNGSDNVTLSKDGVRDTILIKSILDCPSLDVHDTYLYFEVGKDKIDLSAVDAITKTAADDDFTVVKSFTGKAGELEYTVSGASSAFPRWEFAGDVNGDGKGDVFFTVLAPSGAKGSDISDWFIL